ncbi:hypothetical protein PC116_g9037 [Phytophthora cactorum]|uniref:Uncharacterized protein n=1 Tax=Phytophthora cactorum TaxID=29920 RepID=A0A8T0Z974_9STRA|nr:hypothetical protein GQ600_11654 [Phytophthora cactorum]KAG2764093.1 hypothetical protein Pcac1_g24275 [Phytophthora cactorum]KAG2816839.1 hypothetical protein PC111_g12970 [Phytophthora cactorum]KAG2858757.1 hypothetical protein PC113_g9527 [Phytophthora cactorum]KAG2903637.1 hypothetical protein PC115_g15241 [Phytophthora cactorum]
MNLVGLMRSSPTTEPRSRPRVARPQGRFLSAQKPIRVAHLREMCNPTGVTFPTVPLFGWCDCSYLCRVGTCRSSLMQLYCNSCCCPYEGKCGNGLAESTMVRLARNALSRELSEVAAEDIEAGKVLG